MQTKNYRRTKYACYLSYLGSSPIFSLPPLLFVTFRQMYGISYTLLGTLVVANFCTQLLVDLIFSFFSKHFNIEKTARVMPILTSVGMFVYAMVPTFFPEYAYIGLLLGTVIFSVSAGLGEVLISPMIAAIPSENPERDMSFLHSLYAGGVLMVVFVSSFFLKLFGSENWMWLTIFWAFLPLVNSILFFISPIPDINSSHEKGTASSRGFGLFLCALCIFLGSAAENTMTNWVSSYVENVLCVDKIWGDILGMALFALFLGLGRILYAKYGKNIFRVLLGGMIGSVACYLVAGLSPNTMISMVACILTGFCTSMLWPGTLILMEEKFPCIGVAAYAMMAAGGDFGASVAPQLLGIVVDTVAASSWAERLAPTLLVSPEQLGMKVGMLATTLFPILGIAVLFIMKRHFKKVETIALTVKKSVH